MSGVMLQMENVARWCKAKGPVLPACAVMSVHALAGLGPAGLILGLSTEVPGASSPDVRMCLAMQGTYEVENPGPLKLEPVRNALAG